MSKDSMSKDGGMKKDSMSKDQMSKDSMSKEKMSKDSMSKRGVGKNLQDHVLVSGVVYSYKGKVADRPADSNGVEAEVYLSSGVDGSLDAGDKTRLLAMAEAWRDVADRTSRLAKQAAAQIVDHPLVAEALRPYGVAEPE
jgi:hypothetical protein